ncbi:MAG TPA: glycosyltransferase family 87 protein [Stellaceae bacterium]|nr:glycosyltransferase family 87 protein [Stellaceae bacterium]
MPGAIRAALGRLAAPDIRVFAIVAVLAGLYGWAVFATTFWRPGLIGLDYDAPATDWMVFYLAAKRALSGGLAGLYDGAAFTAQLNAAFADRLARPMEFRPFLYPPHFLLVLAPFGLLPFAAGYALFVAGGFAALAGAAATLLRGRGERSVLALALLLCPAAAITATLGQNAFLTAALLVAGFGLRRRAPLVAGMLLGLLTYKPPFWLLVPVALVAARDFRVLVAAIATALLLAALSALLFGIEPWRDWLLLAAAPPADFAAAFLRTNRLWGIGVFPCAVLLGAPPALADALQAAVSLAAAAVVYRAFRRPADEALRVALLLPMVLLAAPHAAFYELLLPTIAACLLVVATPATHQAPKPTGAAAAAVLLLAWLAPLLNPPAATRIGLATPAIVAALGVPAWRRMARPPA